MIRIENLDIQLPGFAVSGIDLHVPKGGFFALMGPTGSGKTLVLESVAGVAPPCTGRITVHGRDITRLPPERRNVSLVYQDHALFPHLTVLENATYGQRYHGMDAREGRAEAGLLLERLGMAHLMDRKPGNLSGGEKQRVSIARALACRPDVVLLDEPLSSLDPQFRSDLRLCLKELHQDMGTTFLMVTHDFVDAMTLADHAAVIRDGRLEQTGSVSGIFRKPATPFVARFVGMTNVFPAFYRDSTCRFCGQSVPLDSAPGWQEGHAALRPEDVSVLGKEKPPRDWCVLQGRLERIDREGFTWMANVRCGEETVTATLDRRLAMSADLSGRPEVCLGFAPAHLHHLPRMD